MIPAPGQGALAVQCREDNLTIQRILASIHCPTSAFEVSVERAFLSAIGSGCSVPAACFAILDEASQQVTIHGAFSSDLEQPLRRETIRVEANAAVASAESMAERLNQR